MRMSLYSTNLRSYEYRDVKNTQKVVKCLPQIAGREGHFSSDSLSPLSPYIHRGETATNVNISQPLVGIKYEKRKGVIPSQHPVLHLHPCFQKPP
jgi:hypothetical protein